MAIEFLTITWQMSPYKAEKLLAHLAFADWANIAGEFHPSADELAEKARLTRRGAFQVIAQMIEDGEIELIVKGGGRGQRNRYRFAAHYREAVAKLSHNWERKRAKRTAENGERETPFETANGERETPNRKTKTVNEKHRLRQQTVNEKAENGERESSAYKELSPSCIFPSEKNPSEREASPALSGCLPILIEAYKNIAKDRVSQDQLSWQYQQIEADGATSEEIQAWLKSRRSLSSVRFIAQDFRTWRESQKTATAQGSHHAKTQSSTTDHAAIVGKFRSNRLGE